MASNEESFWSSWVNEEYGAKLEGIREHVYGLLKEEALHSPAPEIQQFERHCKAVEDLFHRLIPYETHEELRYWEKFVLLASAWLHDLGKLKSVRIKSPMGVESDEEDYSNHHKISREYVYNHFHKLGLTKDEGKLLGKMCFCHSSQENLPDDKDGRAGNISVRLRLLVAYLRLADALHIDSEIEPEDDVKVSKPYNIAEAKLSWIKSRLISDVDIDHKNHIITVAFKKPSLPSPLKQADIQRSIAQFQDAIIEDLSDKLHDVKIPLLENHITYYTTVTSYTTEELFSEKELTDLIYVTSNFFVSAHPSASRLALNILSSLAFLCGYQLEEKHPPKQFKVEARNDALASRINNFLEKVNAEATFTRRHHSNIRLIIKKFKIPSDRTPNIKEYVNLVNADYQNILIKRVEVRRNAFKLLNHLNENNNKIRTKVKDHLDAGKKSHNGHTINIILFGFSELALKTVCGFRDALQEKMFPNHQQRLYDTEEEKAASLAFRFFICEGQPKTMTGYRDRLVYHDGYAYAAALLERKFVNICLIPDIVVDNVLDNNGIDFVILGATSFNDTSFVHSAGHGAIVNLARSKKGTGRSFTHPIIVLSVTKDKYYPEAEDAVPVRPDCVKVENFRFWTAFGKYSIRENIWVTRDLKIQGSVNDDLLYHNPLEDRIAITSTDFVITETKFYKINDNDDFVTDFSADNFVHESKSISSASTSQTNPKYHFGISYAGEDMAKVKEVVRCLQERGINVYYSEDRKSEMLGEDVLHQLALIYRTQCAFFVPFVSRHYAEKPYTKFELKTALDKGFRQNTAFILPVKMDDTLLPELPETTGHIDLRNTTVESAASILISKLAETDAVTTS